MAVAFVVMTVASYVVARLYVSSFRIFATTAVSFFVDALGATSGFGQSVYFFCWEARRTSAETMQCLLMWISTPGLCFCMGFAEYFWYVGEVCLVRF